MQGNYYGHKNTTRPAGRAESLSSALRYFLEAVERGRGTSASAPEAAALRVARELAMVDGLFLFAALAYEEPDQARQVVNL